VKKRMTIILSTLERSLKVIVAIMNLNLRNLPHLLGLKVKAPKVVLIITKYKTLLDQSQTSEPDC
jgi:hypothetical protein